MNLLENDLLQLENKIINLNKENHVPELLKEILINKINQILNNCNITEENYNIITEMRFDLSYSYSEKKINQKVFAALLFYTDLIQNYMSNNL